MKNIKITVFCLFCFMINNSGFSQNYSSALGILGGYAQDGAGVLINYNYYLDREAFVQAGAFYSINKNEVKNIEVPYNIFTFNVGYFKSIYTTRRNNFKFNIGGGLLGGYEVINNGNNELDNGALVLDKSQFIYGAFLSGEADIYLSNEWSAIIKYNQYYHHNSDLGKLTPFIGAGFRYFLF